MKLSIEQLLRLNAIVDAWNKARGESRRRATQEEVINYMLQQEEIGIEAMLANDDAEAEGDERPLPPVRLATFKELS